MNSRQLHYLKAMDVDVWVRKAFCESSIASPLSASAAAMPIPLSRDTGAAHVDASWDQLAERVRNCIHCELHKTRKQTVFGVGKLRAEWMIIGEAPGADEDQQGEPFVGRAGQLLNTMLFALGFPREQVYIANVMKCRPPGNRDPKPEEVACCSPYLARQIELVNPRVILCVGRIAAQNLLNTDTPIGKLRGQVHRLGEQQRPVVVTYHPAYLLRSPGEKRKAWQDLQLALATYADTPERPV
ncbi:MAG: uracil-DNA glycosylase family protein [Steroidobacteraceae bacterium]